MARRKRRKRLNMPVLLMGIGVVMLLVVIGAVAFRFQRQDPEAYRRDAEAAVTVGDYETAVMNFRRALGAVKSTSEKVDLLFALADAYIHTDQWPKVLACWNQVVVQEPGNVKARLALLDAMYVQADSQTRAGWQVGPIWREVEDQAQALITVAEEAQILGQKKSQWQVLDLSQLEDSQAQDVSMSLYLHFLRGRAAYEQARMGAMTDPNEGLARAQGDLEAVVQEDKTYVEAYWYLSRIVTERGENRHAQGEVNARYDASQAVDKLLSQAVEEAPDDAKAHTYLLEARLERARSQFVDATQRQWELAALEKQYLQLTDAFAQSPEVFASLARFYWIQAFFAEAQQRQAKVDQAIEAARRASRLAPERVDLMLALGEVYFRKALMTQDMAHLDRAMAIGDQALLSPQAVDTSGPRTFANKANRLSIYAFLANCAIEKILYDPETAAPQSLLEKAQTSVAQVEQLLGSEDDPEVAKWQGMLALAHGQREQALCKLVDVYEKAQATHEQGGGTRWFPIPWHSSVWSLRNWARRWSISRRP